jgi:malonyl-CoA O-methyltransferase
MINKNLVRDHFNHGALYYDRYAKIQKKMAERLSALTKPEENLSLNEKNILDIGCGTGFMLLDLIKNYPASSITAVDLAPKMLEVCRNKFKLDNLQLVCGDIEEIPLKKKYGLIVSNAAFQWLNNLSQTLTKLYSALSTGGVLAFSVFGRQTFPELRFSYKKAADRLGLKKPLLAIESFPLQEDFKSLFPESRIRVEESIETEYYGSALDFLRAIKKIGAGNNVASQNILLLKEAMKIYDQEFKEEGKIKASYHCVYVVLKT